MAIVALALFLANVPGQIVVAPRYDPLYEHQLSPHSMNFHHRGWLEHGWPLVYLWRTPSEIDAPGPGWKATSLWNHRDDVYAFRWTPLLTDAAIAIVLLAIAGIGFQAWRRRRTALWRFSLFEFLLFVVVACVACAIVRSERLSHLEERLAVKKLSGEYRSLETQPFGPSWLRTTALGDQTLGNFDRVANGSQFSGADLAHLGKFRQLRRLDVFSRPHVSQSQLASLADASSLESLDLSGMNYALPARWFISIPRLPNLRYLNVSNTHFRGDGIENCPKLRILIVSNTQFGDEALSRLAMARRLDSLSLARTKVTGAGMKQIATIENLRILNLAHLPIGDADLAHLAQMRHLRGLALCGTQITDASIPMLCQLPPLTYVELPSTVSVAGRMKLTAAHGRAAIIHAIGPANATTTPEN